MGTMRAEQDLENAFAAYKSASTAWRAASATRARTPHVDLCAERLVRARVHLYELLTAGGWEAPPQVSLQLERDRALVALPDDLEALLSLCG